MSASVAASVPPNPETPQRGYYGVPVIHASHWKWLVIWYFFFGGISGAAAVISAFARLFGGSSAAPLARIATYVSFATLVPCPPLLILDLGRPQRFLNMIRTVRPRSPMSVGSWGLTVFGLVSTLATLHQITLDRAAHSRWSSGRLQRLVGRVLAVLSGLAGFLLAGYTGTLLAATAVPLWSRRPALLGPLFLSSAMTSGAAAVAATASVTKSEAGPASDGLHRLEAISTIAEGALLAAWIFGLGATGKPITDGRLGTVIRQGVVGIGMVLPLASTAVSRQLPKRFRRPLSFAASVLTLAGGFALRYAVVEGGRRSADDPQATFDMTG